MLRFGPGLLKISLIAVAASFALSVPSFAQRRGGGGGGPQLSPEEVRAQQEETDFNNLLSEQDTDKKIKEIKDFLNAYPKSKRIEIVDNELVTAYYSNQDWPDFYATSDKTIAAYPDDVNVLAFVGWVIPHSYNAADPDSPKKLDKAAGYETHAIALITAMPKPAGITDDQFNQAKASKLSQAHSGLGLVYFRQQNWDGTVTELQAATQSTDSPDPADLYALGFSLEKLKRYVDAADAYDKCAATPSQLQDGCKSSADKARSQALQTK